MREQDILVAEVELELASLVLDPRLQMRERIDQQVVGDYRDAMHDGAEFPPIDAVRIGDAITVVDGWHRVLAARADFHTMIRANVMDGTALDALKAALHANSKNGLHRSRRDKRIALIAALRNDDLRTLSDRDLGDLCGVSHTFVAMTRAAFVDVTPALTDNGAAAQVERLNKRRRMLKSKTKYELLKAQLEQANAKIEEAESAVLENDRLRALHDKDEGAAYIASLQDALKKAEGEQERLQADNDALRNENAALRHTVESLRRALKETHEANHA